MSDFTLKDRDGDELVLEALMDEPGVRLRLRPRTDVGGCAFDLDGPLLDQLIADLQRRRAELPGAPKRDGSRHSVLFAHGHHGSEDVNERLVARMYGAVGERARQRRARLAAGEGLGAARRVRP